MNASEMSYSIAVAGISQARTLVNLRELLHFETDLAAARSQELAGRGHEALAFSTCNRTEVYVTGCDPMDASDNARSALVAVGATPELLRLAYVHADDDAARHLFRVAGGLESIVLGDVHVAAQVRRAHRSARLCGATGPLLDRLFEHASHASKRIRTETTLSSGAATIPGAALRTAARQTGSLEDAQLLVVGAGAMARVVAFTAAAWGCREIVIANRSYARARELALRVNGRAVRLTAIPEEVAGSDAVVVATSSREVVLGAAQTARRDNPNRPLVIFDLAMPRNVDPAVRMVPGVRLLDLDDLGAIVSRGEALRRNGLEVAEAIVADEAARWETWRRGRRATDAINELRSRAEQTRRLVLARHATALSRLEPEEQDLVETITSKLVAKLLHAPTVGLRDEAGRAA